MSTSTSSTRMTKADQANNQVVIAQMLADGQDPSESAPGTESRSSNKMTTMLGLTTSTSRCREHMIAGLTPEQVRTDLSKKRSRQRTLVATAKANATSAHEGESEADVAAAVTTAVEEVHTSAEYIRNKEEISDLVKQSIHIGGETPIAMAAITTRISQDLIQMCFENTLTNGRKNVEIGSLHQDSVRALDIWPLIQHLDVFTQYDPEEETRLKAQYTETNAKNNARDKERKQLLAAYEAAVARRTAALEAGTPENELEPLPEEVKPVPKKSTASRGPTNFKTYIGNAVTKCKQRDERYKSMRVSQRLRTVLSDVIVQFIARFCLVARNTIRHLVGVRTFLGKHIYGLIRNIYLHSTGSLQMSNELILYTTGLVAKYHKITANKPVVTKEYSPEETAAREAREREKQRLALEARLHRTQKAIAKKQALLLSTKDTLTAMDVSSS